MSGSALASDGALLDQPAHDLLGEQRVAAGPLRHLPGRARAPARRRQQGGDQVARLARRQRVEEDRRRARAARHPSSPGARAARRGPGIPAAAAPRTHCARCSTRSSMPSSAQWMSSKARTIGRSPGHRLDHPAHERRRRPRACAGGPRTRTAAAPRAPRCRAGGRCSAALRWRARLRARPASTSSSLIRVDSFVHATSAASPSAIRHSARRISARAQYTMPDP